MILSQMVDGEELHPSGKYLALPRSPTVMKRTSNFQSTIRTNYQELANLLATKKQYIMKNTRKAGKTGRIIAAGAAVGALTAATYTLVGPDGKKNRQAVAEKARDMREAVAARLSEAKTITKSAYDKIVSEVGDAFAKSKDKNVAEVRAEVKRLKDQWTDLAKSSAKAVGRQAKNSARTAAKTAKKAVKKTAKRATKAKAKPAAVAKSRKAKPKSRKATK